LFAVRLLFTEIVQLPTGVIHRPPHHYAITDPGCSRRKNNFAVFTDMLRYQLLNHINYSQLTGQVAINERQSNAGNPVCRTGLNDSGTTNKFIQQE